MSENDRWARDRLLELLRAQGAELRRLDEWEAKGHYWTVYNVTRPATEERRAGYGALVLVQEYRDSHGRPQGVEAWVQAAPQTNDWDATVQGVLTAVGPR